MKLKEEQLRRAALLARTRELAQLPDLTDWNEQQRSPEYEQKMKQLMAQVARGELKPTPVPMGWQYYTKRGAAAVLVGALISCAAAPQAVMAGYEKLIEVVETVLDEYTLFQFNSNVPSTKQFIPMRICYLPDGLTESERETKENSLFVDYTDTTGRIVLVLQQRMITEKNEPNYIVDTEDAQVETIQIQGDDVLLIAKEEWLQFVWQHNDCLLTGQTIVSKEELMYVLQGIEFE